MFRYWLALVLLMATLLIGCGGGMAAPKSSPGGGGAVIPGSLSPSASTIDFGNVAVGTSSSRSETLTATTSAVTVSSASWNGPGYSVSGITFPVTVMAGATVPFTVTFTPQASGAAPGSVSFISNASNSPTGETLTGMGTQAQPAVHNVALSWGPSPSAVIGYNLYRGTTSGGPYPLKLTSSVQATTTFVDNTVLAGTTYFYVATSVDQASVESTYSNEIKAAVP
jgi:hypothetical protein